MCSCCCRGHATSRHYARDLAGGRWGRYCRRCCSLLAPELPDFSQQQVQGVVQPSQHDALHVRLLLHLPQPLQNLRQRSRHRAHRCLVICRSCRCCCCCCRALLELPAAARHLVAGCLGLLLQGNGEVHRHGRHRLAACLDAWGGPGGLLPGSAPGSRLRGGKQARQSQGVMLPAAAGACPGSLPVQAPQQGGVQDERIEPEGGGCRGQRQGSGVLQEQGPGSCSCHDRCSAVDRSRLSRSRRGSGGPRAVVGFGCLGGVGMYNCLG
mmetsp:Transcript_28271/g.62076  ORF Transcript_28271/g.62076 Transcript_28271/m.62076 type:complete len:267 (-) Transcript_28271:502-1302(-)